MDPRIILGVIAALVLALGYLMSPWHTNNNGYTVDPHFGFATVRDKANHKMYLCVGSLSNCELMWKRGDAHARIDACRVSGNTYRFCGAS